MPRDKEKQKAAQRRHYLANKEKYAANVRRRRKEYQEWFAEIKSKLNCCKCPETHPATLDFHHIDPAKKDFDIGTWVAKLYPKKQILAEIEKCIVLCANCHRKMHWDD